MKLVFADWRFVVNWIECEFTTKRYLVLSGTEHCNHVEQYTAIGGYVRWRNTRE